MVQAVGKWDTSNITNMSYMFLNASSFNQDIDGWNTGNLEEMHHMFNGASSFNGDINNWNTGNVTGMSLMFHNANNFDRDLSGWCVEKIANKPANFDTNTAADFMNNAAKQPQWGTCPENLKPLYKSLTTPRKKE